MSLPSIDACARGTNRPFRPPAGLGQYPLGLVGLLVQVDLLDGSYRGAGLVEHVLLPRDSNTWSRSSIFDLLSRLGIR